MSEFQELIKNIDKCRDYVRDFFVYGFKSRSDFSKKSGRTYDDERRRIESWLSEYVHTDINPVDKSKNISLQMDSNLLDVNPLFRIWKVKSFTDNDIVLHFLILDVLTSKNDAIVSDDNSDTSCGIHSNIASYSDVGSRSDIVAFSDAGSRSDIVAFSDAGSRSDIVAFSDVGSHSDIVAFSDVGSRSDIVFLTDRRIKSTYSLSATEIADKISENYGFTFDTQIVRRKCNEYVEEGLLIASKSGKTLLYSKAPTLEEIAGNPPNSFNGSYILGKSDSAGILFSALMAVSFFQLCEPFGYIGSTILDNQHTKNSIFRVKHDFPSFTLEDGILFTLITAMHKKKFITMEVSSNKQTMPQNSMLQNSMSDRRHGVPLKIFVSTKTGRRFLCYYVEEYKKYDVHYRFKCIRLDMIKNVSIIDIPKNDNEKTDIDKGISSYKLPKYYTAEKINAITEKYDFMSDKLRTNLDYVWGVSFTSYMSNARREKVELTLAINEEHEKYILKRLEKEGHCGTYKRIAPDTFMYEKIVFDANEMFPWLRTFIGRIVDIHFFAVDDDDEKLAENEMLRKKFINDIKKMYSLIFS